MSIKVKSIMMHPTRGKNPALCQCPVCGQETSEIALLGTNCFKHMCYTCNHKFIGPKLPDNCPKCKGKNLLSLGEVGELEHVSGNLCKECQSNFDLVKAGGIYWSCKDCAQKGVIRAGDFAAHCRKLYKTPVPAPLLVLFTKANCPACGPKE